MDFITVFIIKNFQSFLMLYSNEIFWPPCVRYAYTTMQVFLAMMSLLLLNLSIKLICAEKWNMIINFKKQIAETRTLDFWSSKNES